MSVQYPAHLTNWIKDKVNALIGFSDDTLTAHLLSFPTRSQLLDYATEMFGANKAVTEFVNELWRRKTGESAEPVSKQRQSGMSTPQTQTKSTSSNSNKNEEERKVIDPTTVKMTPLKREKDEDLFGHTTNTSSAAMKAKAKEATASASTEIDPMKGRNLRVKYVAGKAPVSQQARMPCHCQAVTHPLFTNCTSCGKIVCEVEGEGPCFFCGSMVTAAGTFISEEFQSWMKSMEPEELVKKYEKDEKKTDSATTSSPSTAAPSTADADAAGLAKAEQQRNKLLAFASSKTKGSQIYDDQNDWYEFESNSWLSKEARAKKKEQAEQQLANLERRKAHTLTIDLENKKIVTHSSDAWKESLEPEATQPKWTDEEPADSTTSSTTTSNHGASMAAAFGSSKQLQQSVEEMKIISKHQYYSNDTLTGRAKQVYDELKHSLRASSAASSTTAASSSIATPAAKPTNNPLLDSLRAKSGKLSFHDPVPDMDGITDSMTELELEERLAANRAEAEPRRCGGAVNDEDEPTNCAGALERPSVYSDSQDTGTCLSMWQPWASLLVLGIKRFEGRGWYTGYRGRLWIAAGSRETTPEEIEAVEQEYRQVYGPNAKIPFPKDYPTSALLGCVDLTHCWSAEEFQTYRANHGAGGEDSASAFVFVCSNPRLLPLPQSHSGQHKLYHLPPKLYQTLAPNLKPVSETWRTKLPEFKRLAESSGFDIWPNSIRPASTSSVAAFTSVKPAITVIQPGMLLLKQALPLAVQQSILDCVRHIGLLGGDTGFTTPTFKDGPSMNLKMLCLGMYWNHQTKKWEPKNSQGKVMHKIPEELLKHVERILGLAVDYLQSHGAGSMFPSYVPDLCIVNYYSAASGKLGVHQDHDESHVSIKAGYPVISFSIGDTAEFVYGPRRIPDEKLNLKVGGEKYESIHLVSGDALLFGGPSRLIYHGVDKILPSTKPRELFMIQGRLNLTFRKL